MVVNYNNLKTFLSKIFSIIIIFQIFNSIKEETPPDSINKDQTINRIIYIGDLKYRYMNLLHI